MKPLYKFNKKTKQNKKNHYPPSLIYTPKQGIFPPLPPGSGGREDAPHHLRVHTTVHFWRTLVATTPR